MRDQRLATNDKHERHAKRPQRLHPADRRAGSPRGRQALSPPPPHRGSVRQGGAAGTEDRGREGPESRPATRNGQSEGRWRERGKSWLVRGWRGESAGVEVGREGVSAILPGDSRGLGGGAVKSCRPEARAGGERELGVPEETRGG